MNRYASIFLTVFFAFVFTGITVTGVHALDEFECYNGILAALALGDTDEAEGLSEDCLDDFPDSFWVWEAVGYIDLYYGDYQMAAESFSELLAMDPEDLVSRHLLAYAYLLGGNKRSAMEQANYIFDNDERYETPEQVLRILLYHSARPTGLITKTVHRSSHSGKGYSSKSTTDCVQERTEDDSGTAYLLGSCQYNNYGQYSSSSLIETATLASCSTVGCFVYSLNMDSQSSSSNTNEAVAEIDIYAEGSLGYILDGLSGKKAKTRELESQYETSGSTVSFNDPPAFERFPLFPGRESQWTHTSSSSGSSSMDGCYDTMKANTGLGALVTQNAKLNLFGKATQKFKVKKECMQQQTESSTNSLITESLAVLDIATVKTAAGTFEDCLEVQRTSATSSTSSYSMDNSQYKKTFNNTHEYEHTTTYIEWTCPLLGTVKTESSQELQQGYHQESTSELEEYNVDVYEAALAELNRMLR